MTIIEERITASATEIAESSGFNDAFNAFIDNLEYHQELIFNAVDVIKALIRNSSSKKRWVTASRHFHWKSMSVEALKEIVSMVTDNENGDILIEKIFNTNKLFLDDFEEISHISLCEKNINLSSIDKIILKVLDLGAYFDQAVRGENLATRFMNATIEFLDKNNDLETLQKIAVQYEWKQFGVKFLRTIALWACDHEEYGYAVLQKIIETKKLHLCDLVAMSKIVQKSQIKWALRDTLLEASIISGCKEYGETIVKTIVHPIPYTQTRWMCRDLFNRVPCQNCRFSSSGDRRCRNEH